MKYLFLDCESNGLRGEIFSAALVGNDGEVLFDGFYKHPLVETNPWLMENVVPNLTGIQYDNRVEFLKKFARAYKEARDTHGNGTYQNLVVVAYCPCPVEANLFQELYELGVMSEFEGPYPFLDTAPLLLAKGFDPTSEEAYAAEVGLVLPEGFTPHSALSDAQLTRLVWNSLLK